MCKTATYLINISPLPVLGNISPYEKLYGEPPTLSHLKSFGCLCFVSTLKHNRSKFHSRADISIFIGYFLSEKAYKIYNPKTNFVIFSRDVTFHEHHFPYHSTTPTTSPFFTFYLPAHTSIPPYDDSYFSSTPFSIPSDPSYADLPMTPTNRSSIPINTASSLSSNSPVSLFFLPTVSTPPSHSPNEISLVVDLSHPPSVLPLLSTRKSTHVFKPPSHLKDFVCTTTHWCNLVTFQSLPSAHQSFLASHNH